MIDPFVDLLSGPLADPQKRKNGLVIFKSMLNMLAKFRIKNHKCSHSTVGHEENEMEE